MQGLLESVLNETNLNYISDLSGDLTNPCVKRALQSVFASDYGVEEWSEAVFYLTKGAVKISSIKEVVEFIESL